MVIYKCFSSSITSTNRFEAVKEWLDSNNINYEESIRDNYISSLPRVRSVSYLLTKKQLKDLYKWLEKEIGEAPALVI